MERIRITKENKMLKSGEYLIDSFDNIDLQTEVNSECDILLTNLSDSSSLKLLINKDSKLTFSVLADKQINNANIRISLKSNASIDGYFADFSKEAINLNCTIDLDEEGAAANFRLASLAAKNDVKKIDVSINHNSPRTYGKVDNYGVCKDDAKITFLGTSYILHGAVKSKTQQNAKIMVFDKASNAIAKPILKIDENDIEASHAAVVGKINDEHLFYLTSRGIDEATAKELITFGYLKPILSGFKEEQIKEHISSLIEGRM